MRKSILFIILFFSYLSATYAQQVNLTFNPTKGKTYQYRYEVNQNITNEVFANSMNVNQNIVFILDAKVLENKNNNIQLVYTYKDVLFEMKGDMVNMKYKYNEPVDNNPMAQLIAKMYDAIVGHPFEVSHASDGSVTEISGIDSMIDKIKHRLQESGEPGQNVSAILDSFFNEKTVKEMFEQSMRVYPGKKVGTGESWNVDLQLTSMLNMDISTVFTLESVNKHTANVSSRSTIKSEALNGEQTSTIIYNLKSGMPQSTLIQQKLQSPEGQTPVFITSEIKITVE